MTVVVMTCPHETGAPSNVFRKGTLDPKEIVNLGTNFSNAG